MFVGASRICPLLGVYDSFQYARQQMLDKCKMCVKSRQRTFPCFPPEHAELEYLVLKRFSSMKFYLHTGSSLGYVFTTAPSWGKESWEQ